MLIVARLLAIKPFSHQHFQIKHFQKLKLFVRILIETRIITKALFKITLKKTSSTTNVSLNYFLNQHFVCILIETRIITKSFLSKYFQTHTTKHIFKQKKVIQKETKSPQITTDEEGTTTFPFHNLPRKLKKTSQRSFLLFFTFPFDKRKVSGDSC